MPGFDNGVVFADNVDFSGGSPVSAKITSDGQLLIGSTSAPNIKVATLTAGNNITPTNGSGSITMNLTGTTNHAVQVGNSSGSLTSLATGSSGQILRSGGASADPAYSTATYPATAGTAGKVLISDGTNIVSSTPTFPNASATSGKMIQSDGTNWVASTPTYPTTAGTSGKVLISNGSNIVSSTPTFPNASATSGKFIQSDGTNWIASTPALPTTAGTNLNFLVSNGTNWTSSAFNIVPDSGTTQVGNSLNLRASTSSATLSGATVKFNGASSTELDLALTNANDTISIGRVAGNGTMTGVENVGVGVGSLNGLTSGPRNACLGHQAGFAITSGSQNVAVGHTALLTSQQGAGNVAIGYRALTTLGNANANTAMGEDALISITTGTLNCALGYHSGNAYTSTESSNICIMNNGVNGESNVTRIGAQGSGAGQQNLCYIAGITGVTVTGSAVLCATDGKLGTVVSSARYKDDIQDLPEDISILNLRPVTFSYKSDIEKKLQYGLVAEEVHEHFPYLCLYDTEGKPDSVKYHELPALLLHEIQKLTKRISELESKITA